MTFLPRVLRIYLPTFFCSLMAEVSLQTMPPANFRFHSENRKCWVTRSLGVRGGRVWKV